jgi:hypothetical protein
LGREVEQSHSIVGTCGLFNLAQPLQRFSFLEKAGAVSRRPVGAECFSRNKCTIFGSRQKNLPQQPWQAQRLFEAE